MNSKDKNLNKYLIEEPFPLIALRGMVVFPGMIIHFDVGRKKSINAINEAMGEDKLVFIVAQRDFFNEDPDEGELFPIGVVAKVRQVLKLQDDHVRVLVEGVYRAEIKQVYKTKKMTSASVVECIEDFDFENDGNLIENQALIRRCRTYFEEYAALAAKLPPDVLVGVSNEQNIGELSDFIVSNIRLHFEKKQEILEILDPIERIEAVMIILKNEISVLTYEQEIGERVQEQIEKNQREYYLREQLKVISGELGDGDLPSDEAQEFREKIEALEVAEEVREKLLDECKKLAKMPPGSHEATVVRGYIETCLALPWDVYTEDILDTKKAAKVLDDAHYGMDKVKERILEIIAVRRLAPNLKGQVICLVGPPGVGKTSIAKSIADSMGRKYVRLSLGGVRDESEIRGHRKTYIGAMPGRIINSIKLAGSKNPLILLDEIDKMSNDFRGDPASAMLEVLDVEQNFAFRDHYIELPFDLSDVLFVTTANDASLIPRPLYDRMEIIQLPSYTTEEKFNIAKRHLLKKQAYKHGLNMTKLRIPDRTIYEIIEGYTREAGVRECERIISTVCRKAAKMIVDSGSDLDSKDESPAEISSVTVSIKLLRELLGPRKYKDDDFNTENIVGVTNGLAWTSVGGTMMGVEVAILDGTGKIELTGSLGDVMKESAKTAVSYIRSVALELGIDSDFYKTKDIHIHVPEGAVPKDGPSAGITIATAMISALTGIPVRGDVAMTGEISLRGRVLPIGGLREKSMAAFRNGIKEVIIPAANEPDLHEVDSAVKEKVLFTPANHISEVIKRALTSLPIGSKTEKNSLSLRDKTLNTGKSNPVKLPINGGNIISSTL